jgi:ArsR family transcriptional regulator, arsenate/arsenite/antimonite-responsive transcriptional repressor
MSNIGDDEVERLAAAFAALSNPQRLRMFIRLASTCCAPEGASQGAAGRCCASEVGAGLELAASTASHHLKELRQAGLMHVERHGRRIDCWASEETLQRLASFLSAWARPAPPARRGGAAPRHVLQKGGGR